MHALCGRLPRAVFVKAFDLFTLIFFPVSCASRATEDRFEYSKKNFEAEISGYVNDKELSAIIQSRPGAGENDPKLTVRFTSPESLEGITVTLLANGECSARLGDVCADTNGAYGLIEPFIPLVSAGEIYSVKKNQDGSESVRICDENCDLIYVFEPNSTAPSRIYGTFSGNEIDIILKNFSFDFDFKK